MSRALDLSPTQRMECGVCWRVYDPAEGDPVWQVAPGTPFAELPEDWRCPNCDAPREKFLKADP
ncbi:MAG TPA: rubredoxin [Methylocystis sp.]|nr:rubredoxin [Methylocystis sp.]